MARKTNFLGSLQRNVKRIPAPAIKPGDRVQLTSDASLVRSLRGLLDYSPGVVLEVTHQPGIFKDASVRVRADAGTEWTTSVLDVEVVK